MCHTRAGNKGNAGRRAARWLLYLRRGVHLADPDTPAQVLADVRRVIDAGAQTVLFTPTSDEAEQAERIAAEIIPKLR